MINHTNKYLYVKISKSASSSITNALKSISVNDSYEKCGHYHIQDLTNDITKDYYKFSAVRNPYSRLVSRYMWAKKTPVHRQYFKNLTFKEFAIGGHERTPMAVRWVRGDAPMLRDMLSSSGFFDNQLDWLVDNDGNIIADEIMKVESLQNDFDKVCDNINIPRTCISHVNKTAHDHYTEYYDDETREIVSEYLSKDINYFNYKFGE